MAYYSLSQIYKYQLRKTCRKKQYFLQPVSSCPIEVLKYLGYWRFVYTIYYPETKPLFHFLLLLRHIIKEAIQDRSKLQKSGPASRDRCSPKIVAQCLTKQHVCKNKNANGQQKKHSFNNFSAETIQHSRLYQAGCFVCQLSQSPLENKKPHVEIIKQSPWQ